MRACLLSIAILAAIFTAEAKQSRKARQCGESQVCCEHNRMCLTITDMSCEKDTDCVDDIEVCCPMRRKCVTVGDFCLPVKAEHMRGKAVGNSTEVDGTSKGLTCSMCKALLPYVKTHECTEKCSSWWSWTQSTCEYLCEQLCKYEPQFACKEAGYCP